MSNTKSATMNVVYVSIYSGFFYILIEFKYFFYKNVLYIHCEIDSQIHYSSGTIVNGTLFSSWLLLGQKKTTDFCK